ncbi:hypothetical protein [Anabaena sp. CCY 9910]|uniref:hypothetical protein n=1 Tax=Anabaena sp. CCY 9910 TaxID=3103870 RepID=UPI0039DF4C13
MLYYAKEPDRWVVSGSMRLYAYSPILDFIEYISIEGFLVMTATENSKLLW